MGYYKPKSCRTLTNLKRVIDKFLKMAQYILIMMSITLKGVVKSL